MSAKIFKDLDVEIVDKIPREYCRYIVNVLREQLQTQVIPAGSTCRARVSGDIDVVVQCDNREELWEKLVERFDEVRRTGSAFFVLYECHGLGYVQVDIWPSNNARDDAWSLAGGRPDGFKGRYRNILLGYLAKRKTIETGVKLTFASPGGYGERGKQRVTNPKTILACLGVPCTPEEATSIEGIVESLVSAGQQHMLVGFDDYLRNPKDHMPEQTEEVISYVNAFLLDN